MVLCFHVLRGFRLSVRVLNLLLGLHHRPGRAHGPRGAQRWGWSVHGGGGRQGGGQGRVGWGGDGMGWCRLSVLACFNIPLSGGMLVSTKFR